MIEGSEENRSNIGTTRINFLGKELSKHTKAQGNTTICNTSQVIVDVAEALQHIKLLTL